MATTPVSIGEYLKTSYEPDAEYVDGVIEERNVGEYDHSSWQGAILAWFRPHAKEWNIRALAALRVHVSPTRYRIPDVVVLDRTRPIEQILTHPPIAVFEVLSPEDTMTRIMRKPADYAISPCSQNDSRYSVCNDRFPSPPPPPRKFEPIGVEEFKRRMAA
jgi:Uma2 family endonuclease